MSKWIISGDTHIHNFIQYNIDNFRLKQFICLAHRLVEIGKEHQADTYVIAGDLVQRAQHHPQVSHVVSEFLSILTDYYQKVYFILGQHDINSKTDNDKRNYINSLVPLLNNKIKYMHQEIIAIGDRRVAFSDWTEKQDLGWIDNKVDVFIGHVTISSLFGQKIDHSKFTIGFAGDIHQPVSEKNLHSTNVPMPNNLSDCQDGSVILLDLDTLDWKRILTESDNFKYLKQYYEDSLPEKDIKHPYLLLRKRNKEIANLQELYTSRLNINEIILDIVEQANMQDINDEVKSKLIDNNEEKLDFNYRLINISIKNFRSIESLDYVFNDGLTYICGATGSGKSSMLRAIDWVLTGKEKGRSLIKLGESDMSVELELVYNNKTYHIQRSWVNNKGQFTFYIDGVEIDGSSMSERQSQLLESLPFLSFNVMLYRSQFSPPLLHELDQEARVNLISRVLNLSLLESHYSTASLLITEIKKQKDKLELLANTDLTTLILEDYGFQKEDVLEDSELMNELRSRIGFIQDKITSINNLIQIEIERERLSQTVKRALEKRSKLAIDANISNKSLGTLSEELDKISMQISTLIESKNKLFNEIRVIEYQVKSLTKSINQDNASLDKILNRGICPTCQQPIINTNIQTLETEFQKNISEHTTNIALFNNKLSDLKNKLQSDIDEIEHYRQEEIVLRKAISIISEREKLDELVKNSESSLYDFQTKYSDCNEMSLLIISKDKLDQELSEVQDKLKDLVAVIKLVKSYETKMQEISEAKEKLPKIVDKLNRYTEYAKLFASSGAVTSKVFESIAKLISAHNMLVTTSRELVNGHRKVEINLEFRVDNEWITYDNLSGGQTCIADLTFISRLIYLCGGCGSIILDEALKFVDTELLESAIDIVDGIQATTKLLITHIPTFQRYDNKLEVKMLNNTSVFTM